MKKSLINKRRFRRKIKQDTDIAKDIQKYLSNIEKYTNRKFELKRFEDLSKISKHYELMTDRFEQNFSSKKTLNPWK